MTRAANVAVFCEISGLIRDEFRERGHNAWSFDLLSIDDIPPHWPRQRWPNYHNVGDALDYVDGRKLPWTEYKPWDLIIAMPPCTYLANSGVRWLYKNGRKVPERWRLMRAACYLFNELWRAPARMICIENPVMHKHARELIDAPYTQTVQPWEFWAGPRGQGEVKRTCFWLKNLPPLVPTTPNETGRVQRVWKMGPSQWRQADRSLTYPGIAKAMADQWSILL